MGNINKNVFHVARVTYLPPFVKRPYIYLCEKNGKFSPKFTQYKCKKKLFTSIELKVIIHVLFKFIFFKIIFVIKYHKIIALRVRQKALRSRRYADDDVFYEFLQKQQIANRHVPIGYPAGDSRRKHV
jgi:hypothetical protein